VSLKEQILRDVEEGKELFAAGTAMEI